MAETRLNLSAHSLYEPTRMILPLTVNSADLLTTGPVCGFCGTLCGHAVKIKFSSGTGVNRTYKAYSGCKYFSDFSMKSAKSYLKGNPCTNRPIECAICSNVFWSYNLFSHYTSSHSFMECPLIMSKEEKKLMLTK